MTETHHHFGNQMEDVMDLDNLSVQFRSLASLDMTDSPVISCYIDNESGRAGYRNHLDARIMEIRKALPKDQLLDFEQALGQVESFLVSDVNSDTKGLAIFSRSGKRPFFRALQFRLPLPNFMSVDSVPHIYELVKLKDTYHRYVLLVSTESHARIVEVNVGNVTKEIWSERPELRKRIGREWTKEHYQNHRRDRGQKFIKEKIEILDRLMTEGTHNYLVLAGNPRSVARVRDHLPKRLRDKMFDIVHVSGDASTDDIVGVTLSAFAEHELTESVETAGLLLDELRTGGLAVAGTRATIEVLARGQVDLLVLSESYAPPEGWKCRSCKAVGVTPAPRVCPQCGDRALVQANIKEEMTRAAERTGSAVEIVRDSDILLEIGGVGCLLRYLTSAQHEQWRPTGHRSPNESGIGVV